MAKPSNLDEQLAAARVLLDAAAQGGDRSDMDASEQAATAFVNAVQRLAYATVTPIAAEQVRLETVAMMVAGMGDFIRHSLKALPPAAAAVTIRELLAEISGSPVVTLPASPLDASPTTRH